MKQMAHRLATGSKDEIEAVSRFQIVSVLLSNMEQKLVIADKANPAYAVATMEIIPSADKQEAAFWSALTDRIIASNNYYSMSEYALGFLNHVNSVYPVPNTMVDARNVRHIGWLERLGFTLKEELPQYGRKELKFYVYTRTGARH